MNISQKGIDFIKKWEGVSLMAYADATGHLTIGVGHLLTKEEKKTGQIRGVTLDYREGLTDKQVNDLLKKDLRATEESINRLVTVPLSQNQFDSLCCFVFNIGVTQFRSSTLLRKLNNFQYEAVPSELKKWRKSNGKILNGLINRRQANIDKLWNNKIKAISEVYDHRENNTKLSKAPAVIAGGAVLNECVQNINQVKYSLGGIFSPKIISYLITAVIIIALITFIYNRKKRNDEGIE